MGGFLEQLEKRRLFAVNLTGSVALDVATPYNCDNVNNGAHISATVRNIGSSNADFPVTVVFYLSKDKKLDLASDPQVGSDVIPSLKAGKSATASDDFTASADPGSYYILAYIDASGFYQGKNNPYADPDLSDNVPFSAVPAVNVFPTWLGNELDGTAGKDLVTLTQNETHQVIKVNGQVRATTIDSFGFFTFLLGASPDRLIADVSFTTPIKLSGGGGNDTLVGGSGADEISGAGGKDKLYGQAGADYLIGGGANDYLEGGEGNDTLSAGLGNDRLAGLAGIDSMLGGDGDDQFLSKGDSAIDYLSGGKGADSADYDLTDTKVSIESVLVV